MSIAYEYCPALDPREPDLLTPSIDAQAMAFAQTLYSKLKAVGLASELDVHRLQQNLVYVLTYSQFSMGVLQRFSEHLSAEDVQSWYVPLSERAIKRQIIACFAHPHSKTNLKKVLRDYRNLYMFRLIFRDLNGLASLTQTMCELSWFAEHLIHIVLSLLYEDLKTLMGTPMAQGKPQQMYVIALGKLGAHELNLSSDVDLMFGYARKGLTQGGPTVYSNQEFFNRLGQRLIRFLSEVTEDGFIFRVDMRLRPFGQSGALVWFSDAMVDYYEQHGREWERYALIKARVLAGDRLSARQFLSDVRPFVFRRYIDFGVFDALRKMKVMIGREVKRKASEQNIKIGEGGIREVEFIVQVFQLLRGGKHAQLRAPSLLKTLVYCFDLNLLPRPVIESLIEAYHFLRQLEHRLQGWSDQQTQDLPVDELQRQRLAATMGFSRWSEFTRTLQAYREQVHAHFSDIIHMESNHTEAQVYEEETWQLLWNFDSAESRQEARAVLSALNDREAEVFLSQLEAFKASVQKKWVQPVAHERLDRLMPQLLQKIYEGERRIDTQDVWARLAPASYVVAKELNVQWAGVVQTLSRVIRLLESVLRRSAYLALFTENPNTLKELVRLCAASPWIADQLATFPSLLDELLDSSALYKPPEKHTLKDELRQQMLRVPCDDLDQQMETLRVFKNIHVLRVAAAEVGSRLALMNVSDYLTCLAEVLIDEALGLVWQQMVDRYGVPTDHEGEEVEHDLIVVGYGKLGGIELSYGSDLDLVFLYGVPSQAMTSGSHSVENLLFYTRLVQRFIHVLSTHTMSGVLYEVDLRLRPSGNKGLVVSSIDAFGRYQRDEAWRWEHQALVRARVVAGLSATLTERFGAIRSGVLTTGVPATALREQVVSMREKMRGHLGSKKADKRFHLKYDVGGMVDIEFIVQYLVLTHAPECPDLIVCTDNVRIIECLGAHGLLTRKQVLGLIQAYLILRAAVHRLALQQKPAVLEEGAMTESRAFVKRCWQTLVQADVRG